MNEPVTHAFTRIFLAVILGYTTVSTLATQVFLLLCLFRLEEHV